MGRKKLEETEDTNIYYQSLADLMSNAFMIAVLFLLISLIKSIFTQNNLINDHKKMMVQKTPNQENLIKKIEDLKAELASAKKLVDTPPIIIIEDSDQYQFALGSAELSPKLQNYLTDQIVKYIKENTQKYGINLVEIIGHTDSITNPGRVSNLDEKLEQASGGKIKINQLKSGSNADLGLMRALAVLQVFQQLKSQDSELKNVNFRAYSAAQLILPNGQLSTNSSRKSEKERRRIEIRFTKLGEEIKK